MHLRPGGNADRLDSLVWRLDGSALASSRIGAARVVRSSSNRSVCCESAPRSVRRVPGAYLAAAWLAHFLVLAWTTAWRSSSPTHSPLEAHVAQSRRMASAEWMASPRPNRRGDDRTGEVERGSCVPPLWQQCVVPSTDASRTTVVPGVAYGRIARRCMTPRRSDIGMSGR
jgi:hypothetical protein